MPTTAPQTGFADAPELRSKNRSTVEQYMHSHGAARLHRHELFTEDGSGGSWNTAGATPLVFHGHAKLAALGVWLNQCFPDWQWHNVRIFETADPNHFWVESHGRGTVNMPGYPKGYCENHYIHSFELEDGRIKRNREFMNPFEQLRALGIPVPTIRRAGLPA